MRGSRQRACEICAASIVASVGAAAEIGVYAVRAGRWLAKYRRTLTGKRLSRFARNAREVSHLDGEAPVGTRNGHTFADIGFGAEDWLDRA